MVEDIASADSPEEAAKLGRRAERQRPALVRQDWPTAKLAVMYAGLKAKVGPELSLFIRCSFHDVRVAMAPFLFSSMCFPMSIEDKSIVGSSLRVGCHTRRRSCMHAPYSETTSWVYAV